MIVALEGKGTKNERLYRGLRRAILERRLPPRSRLPSTRALSRELGLSRNVVLMAFEKLRAEGFLEGRVGSGSYVAPLIPDEPARAPGKRRTGPPPRLSTYARRLLALSPLPAVGSHRAGHGLPYDFRYSLSAAEDFPHAAWSRLVARRARSITVGTLWYGRARGYEPLRQAMADYLRRSRGVVAVADQVIMVNGTQQGMDLVARLLVDRGDRVVVEEPSYLSARLVFAAYGARLVPVPADEHGLVTERLPRRPARLAFVTPSHQFPLGGILPLERRRELLRWAEASSAHILEDDYDSEFRYRGRPVESLQGLDRSERVLYLGTFSKVLFPSLRMGYLVLPLSLVPAVAALKFVTDAGNPTFEQEVLTDFIVGGHFERHLRRASARNGARRAALLAALREHFGDRIEVSGAEAGIHVVLWFPGVAAAEVPAIVRAAAAAGVGVYPVAPYYLRPPRRAGLLLGYTCLSEAEIRAGVRALAGAVWHKWLQL